MGKVKGMDANAGATSPQVLRAMNARRILGYAWTTGPFTASDAMAATGLTRATVIVVCDALLSEGWLEELSDARAAGAYAKGRPARRYALRERAGVVVGLDAGYERMTAIVADLRGDELGRASARISASTPQSVGRLADADERRSLAGDLVARALDDAGLPRAALLALTVGVPAPVMADGSSPDDEVGFWPLMNPGFGEAFAGDAPLVTVENDANLAAIAERTAADGRGRDLDSFIALLVGEGIGAGLMMDRRLIRGRRGAAGEMRFLDHVDGVGSARGLALLARQ